ncbi:MAG: ABC transporter ATP-binding protein [Aeromicrobium sp.]
MTVAEPLADVPSQPSPDSAVLVDALTWRVSGAKIVTDVSFEVRMGEFLAIIGPNGAGKTSLFNLVSGTTPPTSGSVWLLGQDVTKRPTHARARMGLGRTFQTSYLFLGLTVLENVRLQAQAILTKRFELFSTVGRSSDETVTRAIEALKRVGLASRVNQLAGSLSHGDRRKVEIAIVLASEAKVVLLDEPMAGVNSEEVDGLSDLIKTMQVESGAAVLMVEHHLHVVLGLAERVAVMHHGALLAIDTPDRIMRDPRVQTAYVGEEL